MSNAGGILHTGHRYCAKPSTVGLPQVQLLFHTYSSETCTLPEVQAKVCNMLAAGLRSLHGLVSPCSSPPLSCAPAAAHLKFVV